MGNCVDENALAVEESTFSSISYTPEFFSMSEHDDTV